MGNIVDMPLWCWEKNESAATNLTCSLREQCLRPTKFDATKFVTFGRPSKTVSHREVKSYPFDLDST